MIVITVEAIAILALAGVLAIGSSPRALKHLAAALIAHAEALESYRRARIGGLHEWRSRLDLGLPKMTSSELSSRLRPSDWRSR